MISHLHTQRKRLLRRLFGKFVQLKTITHAGEDVTQVPFEDAKFQLDIELIVVGQGTRDYITRNEDEIAPSTTEKFYRFEVLLD